MDIFRKICALIRQESRFENDSQRTVVLLRCVYLLLIAYHGMFFLMMEFGWNFHISYLTLIAILATLVLLFLSYHQSIYQNLMLYVFLEMLWLGAFVYLFGWGCGAQQIMFVVLVLVFFSFYDALAKKAIITIILFLLRFFYFLYSLHHEPYVKDMPELLEIALQVWSSLSFFTLMAVICGFYSSNIETAEKKLLVNNERLRTQANTDPLTGIWNRRSMVDFLEKGREKTPRRPFVLVLCDVDFFKRVNDTYGHKCGDEALIWLTTRIREFVQKKGLLCRWGGEEFLLYFPDRNGDEVVLLLNEMRTGLANTSFVWEGEKIPLTMTFGVEEYDFHSDLDTLIRSADDKLYIGKREGRDRVIF